MAPPGNAPQSHKNGMGAAGVAWGAGRRGNHYGGEGPRPSRGGVSVVSMSEEQPLWRQGFDAIERAVGPPLAAFAKSEPFAVTVGLALRAQREAQARTERTTRRLLHLANLPAGSDVTRILNEL